MHIIHCKKITFFVFTIIVIIPTILQAAQLAAAGAGWQAQSMQEKIASFDKKFAALCKKRKEKIKQLNHLLSEEDDPSKLGYEYRKSIIKVAIEKDRIHPDRINANYCFSGLIHEALHYNDQPFVHFLLQNNANPNKRRDAFHPSVLSEVDGDVFIAQTLVAAGISLKKDGIEALHNAIVNTNDKSSHLVKWYLDQGVPVNEYFGRTTPLLACVILESGFYKVESCFDKVKFLLQEGALLNHVFKEKKERKYYGYNIPQIIKWLREQEESPLLYNTITSLLEKHSLCALVIQYYLKSEPTFYNTITRLMKQHSEYRHNGIKQDLALCKGSENKPLLAPLCSLVVQYYVQDEPTYEALEQIPIPDNAWHQWQRQTLAAGQQT